MLHNPTTNFITTDARSYRQPMLVRKSFRTKKGSTYPICPRCNITMDREYKNYCDRCGQALNWEKYEKAVTMAVF